MYVCDLESLLGLWISRRSTTKKEVEIELIEDRGVVSNVRYKW
jgi:hypothetical protein